MKKQIFGNKDKINKKFSLAKFQKSKEHTGGVNVIPFIIFYVISIIFFTILISWKFAILFMIILGIGLYFTFRYLNLSS